MSLRPAPADAPSNPARARLLRAGLAACAVAAGTRVLPAHGQSASALARRRIPSSGALLPVIGCGTYIGFDAAEGKAAGGELDGVVRALVDGGGSVLDSSPMYGRAEAVTGEIVQRLGLRDRTFLATKVWTSGRAAGIAQMEDSFRLLRTDHIDLMQIHNLLDWRTHLPQLRQWQADGRIRYLGITHYTSSAYDQVEAVLRQEKLDFLQINYAADDREAARRILPLAAERGVAVIINRPFGGGGLLRRLADRPLPGWAGEIGAGSWAQVLLKFVLSQPAVTCAIPGTARVRHMRDNLAAGTGTIPEPGWWKDKLEALR
ncbi:aldo/keto reductase [Bordetella genomosp. 5]|uniref:aldo/keto reductase n=1 Tax=Bordetella genomosp. 5 TaxID=1395608 RepID=UPI000B9E4264|nr:aldo/keto reductase [Bordetella genomosp. 5]OZI43583.1 aldo/keto reductase [Bordetella genomosp. 5]